MPIFEKRKWEEPDKLCKVLGHAWEVKTDQYTQKKYSECLRCGAVKRESEDETRMKKATAAP